MIKDLNRYLCVASYNRQRSGLCEGTTLVIPYEDCVSDRAVKKITLELTSEILGYELRGLFVTAQFYLLSDVSEDLTQYGVSQDCEAWFAIAP